jgi:hypothetical protein
MKTRPILGDGILGILALVCFAAVVILFAPENEQVWDWFIQVAATGIGTILAAAAGIALFNYQSQKTAESREEQLLTALAGETQATQNTLSEEPSKFKMPDGTIEHVILVRLTFLVAEEAIKSGVFTSNEARLLAGLIGILQVHNDEVYFILSTRTGLDKTGVVQGEATHYSIAELKLRQEDIRRRSAQLLRDLEEEGIKVPAAPNQANSAK